MKKEKIIQLIRKTSIQICCKATISAELVSRTFDNLQNMKEDCHEVLWFMFF